MATQQFQNPFLGPDILQKQYQMQQNQRYAQMLMDQGAEPPQGQMVSGHYVAPSITQYLANALKTYVGRKTADDLPNQQAQLQQAQQAQYRNMFGLGGDASNAPSQALAIGAQQGSIGPTNANAQRLGNALAGQPQMPLLPGRSAQDSYVAFSLMGPQEYAKLVAQQGAPTNEQKNLSFMPEAQRNALIAAPFLNNAGKDGVQNVIGDDGRVQAFAVPGYADIQAANAAAKASGAETGKAKSQAQFSAPQELATSDQMLSTIDAVLNHKGLDSAVGMIQGRLPPLTESGTDFKAKLDQLHGQLFLQAYQTLKGGGQITEVEGAKAEAAMAALTRAQSEDQFRGALKDLRSVVMSAKDRIAQRAGIKPTLGQPQGQVETAGTPRIKSTSDYSALPAGAQYYDPSGVLRTKR